MSDNSTRDERRAKGAKVFGEVYKDILSADPEKPTGDDFFDLMVEQLFGEVWSREALSMRDRRLLTMGVIAAFTETDTYEIQVTAALNTGHLNQEQLREIPIHMAHYIGYPKTTRIRAATEKAIHQWEKANKDKSK